MKRTDIDRWTAKRLRQIPSPKGFVIRRGERDIESFSPAEAADVSAFCKPGDVIMAIMADDSVGLTYEVESDGVDAAQAGVSGAVLRVVGEQIGRANEGVTAGYEGLVASYREELRYSRERIKELERQVSELQTNKLEALRLEKEFRLEEAKIALEESKVAHTQKLTEEYVGKAFDVLNGVVDGFLQHHTKRDRLKEIIAKLSPETLSGIMKDLNQEDIDVLLALAGEGEESGEPEASSQAKKLN